MAKTGSERVNEQLARNGQYWVKRFTAVEAMNHQNAQAAVDSIMPAFNKAEREIQKEINDWFIRFADNNEISLAKAQRMITGKALQELKWDIDDYIKYGRENAIDQRWMKELENASAKYHVSRLQALQIRTRQAAEVAFAKENEALADTLNGTYQSGYYHTAYEIQKGLGVGFDVGTIDQNKLDKLLKKPWTSDGLTFSDRIWRSKAQLIESLNTELTQMCILGKSPDEVVNNLTKRLEVSKSQAGRLVMTESAYFASAAQKECFKDLDVEEYEIVATLDSHTSDICRSMDGKHFPMKDFEAGVTAPPFHVWCRSTTVPYFNDEFTIGDTRAARGDDGKTYQVPADMKYEDWKKSFVNGSGSVTQDVIPKNKFGEEIEFDWKGKEEKFKDQQSLITSLSNEYDTRLQKVSIGAQHAAGDVSMSGATLRINTIKPEDAIHEFAHTLAGSQADKYGLTNDNEFWKEIRKIRTEYLRDVDAAQDTTRWISSYEHSSRSIDEFFAEAFTQAKMDQLGLPIPDKYGTDLTYSRKVLDVVDKYFKNDILEKAEKSGKLYANKKITEYIENPNLLGLSTPKEKYDDFILHGTEVKPLNIGHLKGVSYEDGGGYKVNGVQDGRYLQYHPKNNSHHDVEYYKLASGKTGKKRYDINGNPID